MTTPPVKIDLDSFNSQLASVAISLERLASNLPNFVDEVAAFFEQTSAFLKEIQTDLPGVGDAFKRLGEEQWFFDHKMGVTRLIECAKALNESDSERLNRLMASHFRERAESIGVDLAQAHPCRRKYIEAAFEAHKNGHYISSIPLLLMQVDGICHDTTEALLFRGARTPKDNGLKPKKGDTALRYMIDSDPAYSNLSSASKELVFALLSVNQLPIAKHDGDCKPGEMNRHLIMHGRDLNYETEDNSLRAISLINYSAWCCQRLSKEPDGSCSAHSKDGCQ